jgi:hypothetical protein|mmetsp:Transcript_7866/g.15112  ORF Transcript_7866/g.15112 Transcript_7866/m.15112 type:complete len:201 (-) Transcript_7866:1501-2103(-)
MVSATSQSAGGRSRAEQKVPDVPNPRNLRHMVFSSASLTPALLLVTTHVMLGPLRRRSLVSERSVEACYHAASWGEIARTHTILKNLFFLRLDRTIRPLAMWPHFQCLGSRTGLAEHACAEHACASIGRPQRTPSLPHRNTCAGKVQAHTGTCRKHTQWSAMSLSAGGTVLVHQKQMAALYKAVHSIHCYGISPSLRMGG